MNRNSWANHLISVIAAASFAACAGHDPEQTDPESIDHASLWVSAQPKGHTFQEAVTVRLLSDRPSRLFYTLDGTAPTGESAMEYTEPLTFEDDAVLLMFVAQDADGIWSKPQTELYSRDNIINPRPLVRSLSYAENIVFFAPKSDEPFMDKILRITSDGMEPVRISRIYLGPNPEAGAFYNPSAFELMTPIDQVVQLRPGEVMDVELRYHTTETIRSSAIIIESNDERSRDGVKWTPLWGRVES